MRNAGVHRNGSMRAGHAATGKRAQMCSVSGRLRQPYGHRRVTGVERNNARRRGHLDLRQWIPPGPWVLQSADLSRDISMDASAGHLHPGNILFCLFFVMLICIYF